MSHALQANTGDLQIAQVLSEIGDLYQGTLVSIIVKKKGVARGPTVARVTYDDDFVHTLIWSGFHYQALVERSFKKLHQLWGKGDLVQKIIQTARAMGCLTITVGDVLTAIQELEDSFLKVIRSGQKTRVFEGEPVNGKRSSIWVPLEVGGSIVRGAKVYQGPGNVGDSRAPVPGTVYIDGVKLGEKILTSAPNGTWKPEQKSKTVAKDILKTWLPVGLYVRYALERNRLLTIKVGEAAGDHAKAEGVLVDPHAIRSLFKIAP